MLLFYHFSQEKVNLQEIIDQPNFGKFVFLCIYWHIDVHTFQQVTGLPLILQHCKGFHVKLD